MRSYIVEGRGDFPADMLRRDEAEFACPDDRATAEDVNYRALRRVHIQSEYRGAPSVERWASFGWRVIHCSDPAVLPLAAGIARSRQQRPTLLDAVDRIASLNCGPVTVRGRDCIAIPREDWEALIRHRGDPEEILARMDERNEP